MIRKLAALYLILAACTACIWQARAQLTTTQAGSKTAAAAAYTGPGDIVASAFAWWGLRGYTQAYQSKAINVCNAGDVVCADWNVNASGNLVATTVGGVDCSVSTCTIKKYYDQSGLTNCGAAACDVTQATEANRATLTVNCLGSKWCASSTGASGHYYATTGTTATQAQPFTFIAAVNRTGSFTAAMTIVGRTDGNLGLDFNNSANTILGYAGLSLAFTAADSTWHACMYVVNGASSSMNCDAGTATTGSGGAATITTAVLVFTGDSVAENLNGKAVEGGIWPSSVSAGNQTSMNTNIHNYWGF